MRDAPHWLAKPLRARRGGIVPERIPVHDRVTDVEVDHALEGLLLGHRPSIKGSGVALHHPRGMKLARAVVLSKKGRLTEARGLVDEVRNAFRVASLASEAPGAARDD